MTEAKGMVSIRFTPEEVERVRDAAEKEGVSLSEFIRRAIRKFRPDRTEHRVRPGMSLAERKRWRAKILAGELERAHQRAKSTSRSLICSGGTYGQGPVDHARCKGESDTGAGCLCECHDPMAGQGDSVGD